MILTWTYGAIENSHGYYDGVWAWNSDLGFAGPSLVGQWSKVIYCYSDQPRIAIHGGQGRIELHGGSDTVEVEG